VRGWTGGRSTPTIDEMHEIFTTDSKFVMGEVNEWNMVDFKNKMKQCMEGAAIWNTPYISCDWK
jgi:hypothetical protein